MQKIEFECKAYGWKPEDIGLNEPTAGHMSHYLNNSLSIALGNINVVLRLLPNNKQLNAVKNCLEEMTNYVKVMNRRAEQQAIERKQVG